jgi:hypothetical protein
MQNKSGLVKALELTVFSFIILVIVQTVLEDLSVLLTWEAAPRKILVITGFIFDLFFTIEFLVRLYYAVVERRIWHYIFRERGWIDFLASVPLLMFNSGPALLSLFTGGALFILMGDVLNILKVLKAVRIARILRLLRVLKIFKNIKYTESTMAQRHIARITSLTISVIVLVLFGFSTLSGVITVPGLETRYAAEQDSVVRLADRLYASAATRGDLRETLNQTDSGLLKITDADNTVIYSRYPESRLAASYMQQDFIVKTNAQETLYFEFDNKPVQQDLAMQDLLVLTIIIIIMGCFLFIYSPHFALTVTDPVHVMEQGMRHKEYNLEVRIPRQYADDDIFLLAESYNERYLPLKDRELFQQKEEYSELSLDDVEL